VQVSKGIDAVGWVLGRRSSLCSGTVGGTIPRWTS